MALTHKKEYMGRSRYKFYEEHYPYFVTSTLLEESPLFTKPALAQIMLDQFEFLQRERKVTLYAFVLMSNHFHLVVEGEDLSNKLRLVKSYTARQILEVMERHGHSRWLKKLKKYKRSYKRGRTYQVWQEGLHPKQLKSVRMVNQKIGYIHANPVKSGYVDMKRIGGTLLRKIMLEKRGLFRFLCLVVSSDLCIDWDREVPCGVPNREVGNEEEEGRNESEG
jgi:REP element-mobilizing transposase RayT